jgi:hypothetical protein
MQRFLQQLVVFMLIILLLATGIDFFISWRLKQNPSAAAGEFTVWNALYAGKINTDYVIYGSSRAWVHINPQILEDSLGQTAYNLGMDGQNFHLQLLRHLELCRFNPYPKNILLALDAFSLDVYHELYNETQLLPYQLFNHNMRRFRAHYKNYKPSHHWLPLLRYAGRKTLIQEIFSPVKIDSNSLRLKGFRGQQKSWRPEADSVLARLQPFEVKIDSQLVQLFEQFLAEMKNRQVKLTLVYPPEYVGAQNHLLNRSQIIAYYTEQAHKYGFRLLDYSNHPISHDKSNFYNGSHLNAVAADVFTRDLVHKLKN